MKTQVKKQAGGGNTVIIKPRHRSDSSGEQRAAGV